MESVLRTNKNIIIHDQLRDLWHSEEPHVRPDEMQYLGVIRVRELPAMTKVEFEAWWPRLSERERERYTVMEAKNLITTAGRTQILTFVGSASGTTPAFAQYFSVGTFPINSVQPGDTGVNSELYRAVPSASTVTGNTVDISTFFGTSQGNGVLTNCGLYGNGASSTLGTGTLFTHALLNSYNKTSSSTVTFDYLITLN